MNVYKRKQIKQPVWTSTKLNIIKQPAWTSTIVNKIKQPVRAPPKVSKIKQPVITSTKVIKIKQSVWTSTKYLHFFSPFFFLQGLTLSNLDQNSFYACTILPHTFNLFFYSQWTKQNRWRLLVLIQLTVVKQNAVNNDWL